MAKEIDREVLLGFVEEARGYLPRILEGIDHLRRDPTGSERLEETHRLTHSIKGAAGMLGLGTLAQIAHLLEEALEQIGAGQLALDGDTVEVLTDAAASIGRFLDQLVSGHLNERPLITQVITSFRRLRGLPEAGDQAEIDSICPPEVEESTPSPPAPDFPHFETDNAPEPPHETTEPVEESLSSSADLLEAFEEEARDHLAEVSAGLRRLEEEPNDRQALQGVRRSIHTLKGAAYMVGRSRCADLAHRMEDLLDKLHDAGDSPSPEQLGLLFSTADALEDLAEDVASPGEEMPLEEIYGQYEGFLGAGQTTQKPFSELNDLGEAPLLDLTTATAATANDGPTPAAAASHGPVVRVPIARLDEVVRLISELVVSGSTFEQYVQQLSREVGEFGLSTERLKRLSRRFESEYEAFALTGASERLVGASSAGSSSNWTPHSAPEFDELEFDRYTELHRISRELGESSNDLSTLESGLNHRLGDFEGYLNRVSRLTGEIQDKLMRLRMVPIAQLSSRLHRTVRVTARKQGKEATLLIEGEDTALDKTVLEEISDPLLHLLRNAVDHGLEPAALRRVLGKPEKGQIRLRAFHEGTQVVLEVSDDGGGLDDDKLRARAVEAGWFSEAEVAEVEPETLHRLIFEPGFSTASEVSEVSGRGVGLDVVQSVVHRLEGSITVRSQAGAGITFTIRLPLTLAVMRAVLVRSGEHTYALPLAPVRQILRLESEDLEILGSESVVRVREQAYPAVQLGEILGHPRTEESARRRVPALILDLGERRIALLVDRILEARDVVVKPLGSLLRRVPAVTGATLMGDGRVVLILNPQDLAGAEEAQEPRLLPPSPRQQTARRPLEVLVVDDSVSVRRVLSNLMRAQGWNPITARDGMEALENIQRMGELPDAILLDIEMPRMDGYELAATLRAREIYRHIPIIMLTSRAGKKHRQRAFEVGATEYLVKPYQDEVLIQLLRRLTRAGASSDAEST